MSQVQSAKQICERALRAIGAFPVTESAADGEQLREAMIWLDLILGEKAGTNRLFFLIPGTVSFTLQNGIGSYDLLDAMGANAPVDGFQFPINAYLVVPSGPSVIGFSSAVPGTVAVGQAASDVSAAANIPPSSTVAAISGTQVTLSGPSTVAAGDAVMLGTTRLVSTGTVNGTGMVAGTSLVRRHPIEIVKRDVFMARHEPNRTGRPEMIYIDRLPDNQLFVHPYPEASDPQLFILDMDVQTYAPNVAPSGVTGTQPQSSVLTKFRQAWQRYLVSQLSHDLGMGPIIKLPEPSLNRFAGVAAQAKMDLEAFENREQDTQPPICEAWDGDYGDGHNHHHRERAY